MDRLLQIGSVFKVENVELMIIGYSFIEASNNIITGYKCLCLPYGYIKQSDIKFVSSDDVKNIVYDAGNEDSNEFLDYQTAFFNSLKELGAENAIEILKAFEKGVKEELKTDD